MSGLSDLDGRALVSCSPLQGGLMSLDARYDFFNLDPEDTRETRTLGRSACGLLRWRPRRLMIGSLSPKFKDGQTLKSDQRSQISAKRFIEFYRFTQYA